MKKILIPFLIVGQWAHAQIIPNGLTTPPASHIISSPAAYNSAAKINYVRTWEPWKPITDQALVPQQPVADVKQTTAYIDGLGRPLQTVTKQISPLQKDMVAPKTFDKYGKEVQQYLPYISPGADGYFKTDAFGEQLAYYSTPSLNNNQYAGEQVYYSRTAFEASPLGRPDTVLAPGNTWSGSKRGVLYQYEHNGVGDAVVAWSIAAAPGSMPVYSTGYNIGQLYKSVTIDEHGKQVIEYKDKEGKLLLKKVQLSQSPGQNHTGWLCTYYVYDVYNLLRVVIQPKAVELINGDSGGFNSWLLTTTLMDELCFRYEYDHRNRMIIKKVPGAGEVWMVYDARDRLVMTQDANLRVQNKWLVTQYDVLDRPVATGFLNSSSDRAYYQNLFTSPTYAVTINDELTRTYYDDYNYSGAKAFDNGDISKLTAGSNPWPETVAKSLRTYGLVTGSKIKVLGTSQYLITTTYYDEKGRAIQVLADNANGGVDVTTNRYDFSGKVVSSYLKHNNPSSTTTPTTRVLTKMLYDHAGRLIKVWKQINDSGTDKLIAENSYDELGQLKTKKLAPAYNSNAGLETLNYEYTIRGWLAGVNKGYAKAVTNSNWFGFEMSYDRGFSKSQYNGNISGIIWRSKGDGEQRAFGYDYDAVNRLLKADFTQNNGGWNTSAGIDFSMKMGDGINATSAYDANGNIKAMKQWGLKITGSSVIDEFTYNYKHTEASNKLLAVTESVAINTTDNKLGDFTDKNRTLDDYDYDVNGNLVYDKNKNISGITYNHLNLPSVITVTAKGPITYTYDAAGNKLKKVVAETGQPVKTTDYIAGFIYENNVLQFFGHEEGRIRFKPADGAIPASFQYDYMLKDHLGNVRMVLTEEQKIDKYPVASLEDSKVATEDDYYTIDNTKIVLGSTVTGLPAYTNDNGIGNNPPDPAFESANSTKLYKLNSGTNKTGLGITLKVMSGDRIDVHGKSYYFQNNTGGSGANSAVPVLEILNGFVGGPSGGVAAGTHGGVTGTQLNGYSGTTAGINTLLNNHTTNSNAAPLVPKAYINYLFFDEQFKCVGSGFSKVGTNSVIKSHFSELQNLIAPKNGFVYIYASNESPVNVFFDNVQVVHTRGPILEETHYYPFGLTMAGISSKAANITPNKEKTFQGQRFDDELGLNWVQFKWRNHDPQIGRFIEIDPLSDKYEYNSTYAFSENKVIRHVELEGLESWDFMSTLKNAAGFSSSTDSKTFLKQTASKLTEPETYKRAILTFGTTVLGPAVLGIATGGAGSLGVTATAIDDIAGANAFPSAVSRTLSGEIASITSEARSATTSLESGAAVSDIGVEIGILRDAAKGKGNFGLGEASTTTSNKLGQAWVGDGAKVASDGKTLVSESGLRQYRSPSSKNSPFAETGIQSNFEWRNKPEGQWQGNGHLNITTSATTSNKPFIVW